MMVRTLRAEPPELPSRLTLLVGLGHKARQGKDTLAAMIMDRLREEGIDARVYRLADSLKMLARLNMGMTHKDPALLQQVGLDYRQLRGDDVWLNVLLWQIREEEPRVALISDMRFPNEAEAVKSRGGLTIKVVRPDMLDPHRDANHVSETALDHWPFDIVVMNNSHRGALADKAKGLAQMICDRMEGLV